ncbi:IclR family transcriptional regulator [Acidaminobacter hydrogenoformans]|uniref:Transcriptional regulator, IclR family n=1 Tax=Acidaminobacter hydrogenoformans DSM 2784 TaxID=1120920 RepID=A0A1G5S1X0_9FIRM|nr:IclR family transcriptional regulator [Acidaminobacter hydrogenoformans]SCZ80306.1 transcriptional regulator, IclR family [Acidaminobacter hydrogenoformans DSM 2784]
MDSSNSIVMIERAFDILNYIYDHEKHVGVSQIARDLELPKANVYRILNTLHQMNAVEKDDDEQYVLGRLLIKLGNKARNNFELSQIATPVLSKLSEAIGESTNLGIMYGESILTVQGFEGEASTLVSKLVPIAPLYCSSMGKLYLAHMPQTELEAYFKGLKVTIETVNTQSTLEGFLKHREGILKENVAYDLEEYEYGLACIAAPIVNSKGTVIAAISISGPRSRLERKGMGMLTDHLKDAAKVLTEMSKYMDYGAGR